MIIVILAATGVLCGAMLCAALGRIEKTLSRQRERSEAKRTKTPGELPWPIVFDRGDRASRRAMRFVTAEQATEAPHPPAHSAASLQDEGPPRKGTAARGGNPDEGGAS